MKKIVNLSQVLKEFFNETAEAVSLETGFIKRKRKLTGSSFIKAMILGNLGNGKCSIDGLRQFLYEDCIEITKQGLDFRFTKLAVTFMEKMFYKSLELFKKTLQLDSQILQQFRSVKLLDSTYLNLPSSLEPIYKGYGSNYPGKQSLSKAGVKLQLVFDYLNQVLDKLELKEGKSCDQSYKNHLDEISTNDLFIFDLGYFSPHSFKQIDQSNAYFISRYKADTNIYDIETQEKIDLLENLHQQDYLEMPVLLGKQTKQLVRILCKKLSPTQSVARRRKANKLAKSHGYTFSLKNQRLLDWSLLITNIPSEKCPSEQIFFLYKVRWQIELLFKLYKSYIQIETLKGKLKPSRILCELYAKLCIILVFHGIVSCVELAKGTEISLPKAMIELKNRAREFFLALGKNLCNLQNFIKKITFSWSIFSLKDRHRKKRISTLNSLKLLTVNP